MLPLHIAISNGKMELVNLLLENSVADQIKAVNYEHGDSALHLAARKCNTEAIRLLVENGASVNTQNVRTLNDFYVRSLKHPFLLEFLGVMKQYFS